MAATAPNMGLKVWNLLGDSYDHAQLAENWAKVDQHDHTSGKGVQIPTGGIVDGAISSAKIGNEQVSAEKLSVAAAESAGITTAARTYHKAVSEEATYKNETTGYTVVDSATVYVPANARLAIAYMSLQKVGTAAATAQIFVDEIEVKKAVTGGAPAALSAISIEVSTLFGLLQTGSEGLTQIKGTTADSSFVTTGLLTSSLVLFGFAAGTHKIEIKAKAGVAGKIEIKNRNLWVRAEPFA